MENCGHLKSQLFWLILIHISSRIFFCTDIHVQKKFIHPSFIHLSIPTLNVLVYNEILKSINVSVHIVPFLLNSNMFLCRSWKRICQHTCPRALLLSPDLSCGLHGIFACVSGSMTDLPVNPSAWWAGPDDPPACSLYPETTVFKPCKDHMRGHLLAKLDSLHHRLHLKTVIPFSTLNASPSHLEGN